MNPILHKGKLNLIILVQKDADEHTYINCCIILAQTIASMTLTMPVIVLIIVLNCLQQVVNLKGFHAGQIGLLNGEIVSQRNLVSLSSDITRYFFPTLLICYCFRVTVALDIGSWIGS